MGMSTLLKRLKYMERAAGFEPATTCLGSKDSTTELRPLTKVGSYAGHGGKSRKRRLQSSLYSGEFSAADLETIDLSRHQRHEHVGIAVLVTVHFHSALNDQPACLALARDELRPGYEIDQGDSFSIR